MMMPMLGCTVRDSCVEYAGRMFAWSGFLGKGFPEHIQWVRRAQRVRAIGCSGRGAAVGCASGGDTSRLGCFAAWRFGVVLRGVVLRGVAARGVVLRCGASPRGDPRREKLARGGRNLRERGIPRKSTEEKPTPGGLTCGGRHPRDGAEEKPARGGSSYPRHGRVSPPLAQVSPATGTRDGVSPRIRATRGVRDICRGSEGETLWRRDVGTLRQRQTHSDRTG
jgi:hypothetical protein